MRKLNALIAGSTGYIGVQLIRLLVNHKYINIKYLCGNSSVGKNISFYDKSLSSKKLPKIVKFFIIFNNLRKYLYHQRNFRRLLNIIKNFLVMLI